MSWTIEDLQAWILKEKPKYIIARFQNGMALEYKGAETEAEALKVRREFKAKGGQVDVFKGPEEGPWIN